MTDTVRCCRCDRQAPALARPPLPGALGDQVREHVCRECWELWREMEVRVINELRLDFLDPEAQSTLEHRLREFLRLPSTSAD